jgi:spore germination cell wall hydrolase CwlJ-like protein
MLVIKHMTTFFFILLILLTVKNDSVHQPQIHSEPAIERIIEESSHAKKYIRCLADNIYHEARGEPFLGQVAVARVVLNRVNTLSFPSNPCSVIYQKNVIFDKITETSKTVCQFSWVCEKSNTVDTKSHGYQQALDIAKKVITENKWAEVIPSDILYFRAKHAPKSKEAPVMTIGNHHFFSGKKS